MKIKKFAMYTIKYEKDGQEVNFTSFYFCDMSSLDDTHKENAVKCMIAGYLSDSETFDYIVNNVQLYENETPLYEASALNINNNDLKGVFYKLQFSINSTRHFFCDFVEKDKDLSNDEFLKDYCIDLIGTYFEINNLSKESRNKPINLKISQNGKPIGIGDTIKDLHFYEVLMDD